MELPADFLSLGRGSVNNSFVPNIFHICFSHFDFFITKTDDENSRFRHYLPTQNVIYKIISLPKLSYKTNSQS